MNTPARFAACLLLLLAAAATAEPSTDPFRPVKGTDHVSGVPYDGGRPPGETVGDPLPIPLLPFQAQGNTCGYANDYDEICPFGESLSPDLVYRYHAELSLDCVVDLCASLYDTKVFVYEFESGHGIGNPLACNDDAGCGIDGYKSRLGVFFEAGRTYYIVVDGYGSDCGDYDLQVHEVVVPPPLECPPGAIAEGEVDCYDGYNDQTNGGCSVNPLPMFTPLEPTPGGELFHVCGTGGTFINQGLSYRDTDWYELQVTETNTITFDCEAEFPVQIITIHVSDGCNAYEILTYDAADPTPAFASITATYDPGTYWFWVGSWVFSGVPCGSDYIMTIDGYGSSTTATGESSWGGVKTLFR